MQKQLYRVGTFVIALILLSTTGVLIVNSADNDDWQAHYYNNVTLSGTPILSNTTDQIDYNWGTGSPGTNVDHDNFSARWTKTTTLPAGRYLLTLSSDDGSRVFVNNQIVVNQWWSHELRTESGEYDHPGGELTLRVEFFDSVDKAIVSFKMNRIGDSTAATTTATPAAAATATTQSGGTGQGLNTCTSGGWFGNYWNNAFLAGAPDRSRTVGHINFNWGEAAPMEGMNADHWSASWTNSIDLAEGRYLLTLTSDDGSTLWVNNRQFINLWYDHTVLTRSRTLDHPGGPMTLRIEYYDKEGDATIAFGCARLADATPTPVPTIPPTPVPLPIPPTATPQPVPTIDPLLTADAGQCIISNVYVLNLRSAPSLSAAIVTTVQRGDVTTRTGDRSGVWVQIRTFNDDIGWVNEYYCGEGEVEAPVQESAEVESGTSGTVDHVCLVEVDALLIRSGPSTTYAYIGVVYRGDPMRLAGERNADGSWVTVIAPDGTRGWVFSQYIAVPADVMAQLRVVDG